MGLFLGSCENNLAEIEKITYTDKSPAQILKNASIEYTDSGYVRSVLKAPVIEKYEDKQERTVFPKGVEVLWYNKSRQLESRITADFGELSDNNKFLELKNHVVIISYSKGDTLYTEYLKKTPLHKDSLYCVHTNGLVIARGNIGNFASKGIRANDDFSEYIVGQTKGGMKFNEYE